MSYYVTDGIYYGELDGVRYESCTMEHYIMLHYMNWNRDLVKYFIKTSPTVNLQYEHQYGNTILHYAYCNKDHDMVAFLLSKGADPSYKNKYGYIPIQYL